jgi:hypothetical protein
MSEMEKNGQRQTHPIAGVGAGVSVSIGVDTITLKLLNGIPATPLLPTAVRLS